MLVDEINPSVQIHEHEGGLHDRQDASKIDRLRFRQQLKLQKLVFRRHKNPKLSKSEPLIAG